MALIKCKECGKEHSSDAKKCPHCGYYRGGHEFNIGILIVGTVVLIMIVLAFILTKDMTFHV